MPQMLPGPEQTPRKRRLDGPEDVPGEERNKFFICDSSDEELVFCCPWALNGCFL